MSTEALARVLPLTNCQCEHHYSEGQRRLCRQIRERERMWQAERILADPAPLLAALAEAGVAAEPHLTREAEAWDEGFTAGVNTDMGDWQHPPEEYANPYRAALATGTTTNQEEAGQ